MKWYILILLTVILSGCTNLQTLPITNPSATGTGTLTTTYNYYNVTNNITNNITQNITYNNTYYVNITNNITNNITTTFVSNTSYKYQLERFTVSNTTAYFLLPNYTFTLQANKTYYINCDIIANTNITANAPRFRFNYSGTTTSVTQDCLTYTSATAVFQGGSLTNTFDCLSTANIGANVPTPFTYHATVIDDTTPSTFTIEFHGETINTTYNVYQGSPCEFNLLN